MDYIKYGAKALAAAATAFGGAYATAILDGIVTQTEWLAIAVATTVAAGAVFGITNGPAPSDSEFE